MMMFARDKVPLQVSYRVQMGHYDVDLHFDYTPAPKPGQIGPGNLPKIVYCGATFTEPGSNRASLVVDDGVVPDGVIAGAAMYILAHPEELDL